MNELLKALLQWGAPGGVVVLMYHLGWWPYWYVWLPLPVLVFWGSLCLGVEPSWFPGLADLRMQVMGRSPENNPIAATLGSTHQERVDRWAALRQGHDVRNARVLAWLGRWYHPVPFHPLAILRALSIAVGYTLLFWVLPWLLGGSGRLGEADLLGADVPIYWRWILLLVPAPMLAFAWAKQHWALSGWKEKLAFLGAGAVAFAIAVAFARAFAGAFAGAVTGAVAGAFVGTFAFATAFAFAFAFAGAGAFAGIFAGVFAGAGAGVLVVVVVVVVALVFLFLEARIQKRIHPSMQSPSHPPQWRLALVLHFFWLPWLLLGMALPLVLPLRQEWLALKVNWLHISRPSFALVFFLCVLPWLNALSDFVSVGITQKLLQQYRPGRGVYWVVALDVLAAFVLTMLLYLAALGALQLMAWCGWQGIDTQALRRDFVGGIGWNVNSPAFWLVLLAVTNIVPTLLHLGWALWALFAHWLSPAPPNLNTWLQVMAQSPEGKGLPPTDAKLLSRYVLVDWWLNALLVLSFVPPVLWGFMTLIPWTVGWLF